MKKETITPAATPFWRNKRVIPILLQLIFLVVVVSVGFFLISNVMRSGAQFGFQFLNRSASFSISESVIAYSPSDTYAKALYVGFLNTIKVAIVGIILASIIGVLVGVSRLSKNWLIKTLAGVYTEVFRNTPLLVQITIWFFAVILPLPQIENAVKLGGFYFSNRGIAIPWLTSTSGSWLWLICLLAGLLVAIVMWRIRLKQQIERGKRTYPFLWALGSVLILGLAAFLITRTAPFHLSIPTIEGRLFAGGYVVSPGYSAILIGLVAYTSAYIAEVVRAGIQAVPKGQIEAADALGLKSSTRLRLVVFPQAIRIIIPPLTSQYLNLTKNSSLAVAVGYQDIVSIGNTILSQTGREIEVILIMITVYLTLSLLTSLLMNFFNKKYQLVER